VQQWFVDTEQRSSVAGFQLRGHEGPINALSFNKEGTRLTSGSADQTVQIWDVLNPKKNSIILEGHEAWVWSVAFSPSGSHIISSGADRRLNIWNVNPSELAQRICTISSGRVLTEDEWDQYVGSDFDYAESYSSCDTQHSVSERSQNSGASGKE
jgi:WD40 repeat protein